MAVHLESKLIPHSGHMHAMDIITLLGLRSTTLFSEDCTAASGVTASGVTNVIVVGVHSIRRFGCRSVKVNRNATGWTKKYN